MNLPLIPGQLGYTCWPPNPQTFLNDAMAVSVAQLTSSLVGVIVSDTEPAAADRDKVWFRTSAGAPVSPSLWFFFLGQWLAKHPVPAGSLWALPYTGSVASIATLDGGVAGAINSDGTTGPFWEEVVSLRARMPVGAGTLPSGAVLAVGDTGGEEKHELIETELPKITLDTSGFAIPTGRFAYQASILAKQGQPQTDPLTTAIPDSEIEFGGDASGNTVAHNNMPPFLTLTFLRRSARIYCTQPMA